MRDLGVRELELADDVAQEAHALRAALDQREAALGLGDRERHAGQAAAAADVGDAACRCSSWRSAKLSTKWRSTISSAPRTPVRL